MILADAILFKLCIWISYLRLRIWIIHRGDLAVQMDVLDCLHDDDDDDDNDDIYALWMCHPRIPEPSGPTESFSSGRIAKQWSVPDCKGFMLHIVLCEPLGASANISRSNSITQELLTFAYMGMQHVA